jgi:hypothetical protein
MVLAVMGLEFLWAFGPPDAATPRVTNMHLISYVIKHDFYHQNNGQCNNETHATDVYRNQKLSFYTQAVNKA